MRISFFRPNRGTRRIALVDETTAFLQADNFPEDLVKYLLLWDPVKLEWELSRQIGPLYGEAGAPRRWEDTYAGYLEGEKFVRGQNDKSIFYKEDTDLLNLTFVDDNFLDAEESSIEEGIDIMRKRFDCTDPEWIAEDGTPTDFLGMMMSMDSLRCYLSMENYITLSLDILGWQDLKPASRPIIDQINVDGTSPSLDAGSTTLFHKGNGMLGWLNQTGRPDIAFAYSRIGQHQANPSEDALEALKMAWRYLKGTPRLCLSGSRYSESRDLTSASVFSASEPDQFGWEFFVDTDFSGNSEVQNKRRAHCGELATLNSVPVYWKSGVSTMCFANEDIGEAHADSSSGASETFGAGNATQNFLHLKYVSEEMGIPFPKPFKLQMDNEAAKVFAQDSCFKSRMKHIDCRQEWVKMLRDRSICTPVHVPTKDNLADIFTKIMSVPEFTRLRDQIMFDPDA